jgi:proteasome component ECM29
MDLARHSAAVTSRRGAAAGVAGIARLVGEQGAGGGGKGEGGALAALLGQERLAALLPKLYRWVGAGGGGGRLG